MRAGETGLNNSGSAWLFHVDSVVSGDSVLNVGETGLYTVPANVGLNTGSAGWIKRFSSAQYLAGFSFLQQKNET